jgi:pimeloyl-ACP methyl ester carboxylesterase
MAGSSAEADDASESTLPAASPSMMSRTLGGRQFWGDVCFLQGWRIQKNALDGHFRLLDPLDNRHASGTVEECQSKLAQVQQEQGLKPASGRVVVLIHGLIRSPKSFYAMHEAFNQAGLTVVGFNYPSTRVSIPESAELLHQVIDSLGDEVTSIDFVGHSMGGLVLRSFLQQHPDDRFHRAVLLGVPNQGSQIAETFGSNRLFQFVYGPAGQQLGTGEGSLAGQLPVPSFEFGIVAGGRGTKKGFNPLLGADNDSTVTVTSTRLPGAADFICVPVMHSFLMNNEEVIRATMCFLDHGRFHQDQPPCPIPADEQPPATADSAEADVVPESSE